MDKSEAIRNAQTMAIKYCKENSLSESKLNKQSCYFLGEVVCFAQEIAGKGEGLVKDLATRPRPTLFYNIAKNVITPTEFTNEYLK